MSYADMPNGLHLQGTPVGAPQAAAANCPSVMLESPLHGGVYDRADGNSPASPFEPGQGNTKVINVLFDSPDDHMDQAASRHEGHMTNGNDSPASPAPADISDAQDQHADQILFLHRQLNSKDQQITELQSQVERHQHQQQEQSSAVRLNVTVGQDDSQGHAEQQLSQLWGAAG